MARRLVNEGVTAYERDSHEWLSAKTLYLRSFWDLWGIIPAVVPNISDWHQRHGDPRGDPRVLISWWRAISTRWVRLLYGRCIGRTYKCTYMPTGFLSGPSQSCRSSPSSISRAT